MDILVVILLAAIIIFVLYLSYLSKQSTKESVDGEELGIKDAPNNGQVIETSVDSLEEILENDDIVEEMADVPVEKFKARREIEAKKNDEEVEEII